MRARISAIVFQIGMITLLQSHFAVLVNTSFDSWMLLADSVALALVSYLGKRAFDCKTPGRDSKYTHCCVSRLVMTACLRLLTLSSIH